MSRWLAAVVAVTLIAIATPAYGIDQSKGRPGFCPDSTGVTVVVDFQQLGGTTIVRCFPHAGRGTGLDALLGAGFQPEGTKRWGLAFICRIENRPSAVEKIPIEGDPAYQERCVDTAPAQAYWSYWHAGNNCPWVYSQWGVKNRDFIPGGFEGWSFSLNATADANPAPRIAPVRPGTEGGACNAVDEPGPTTNDPNQRQPSRQNPAARPNGAGQAAVGGQTSGGASPAAQGATAPAGPAPNLPAGQPSGSALPPPRPRSTATVADPADNVAYTGGEDAEDITEVIRRQSGASRYAPWAAGVVVVLLAAATWWIARRRSRARNG